MQSIHAPNTLSNAARFLNSVCPGYTELEENFHYSLEDKSVPLSTKEIGWPISNRQNGQNGQNGQSINPHSKLVLEKEYLNISRPPLGQLESTTYVSLPLHLVTEFKKMVNTCERAQEGNMYIGANVNPLTPDPFRNINLNPGAISTIIETKTEFQSRNPFKKANTTTTNIEGYKDLTNIEGYKDLTNIEGYKDLTNIEGYKDLTKCSDITILAWNNKFSSCGKLLVSSHVNVLNIFGLDETSNLVYTKKKHQKQGGDGGKSMEVLVETPLLRLKFEDTSIITSQCAFVSNGETIIVLGFHSGDIMIIKPQILKLKSFDLKVTKSEASLEAVGVSVVALVHHPKYEFLIIAGYTNGEVLILNPFGIEDLTQYRKSIKEKNPNVTIFRMHDLSPIGDAKDDVKLLAHFKISHKAITAITSTMTIENVRDAGLQPFLLAIASADGFVRFIDLMFTFRIEENRSSGTTSMVTDIISNYFNTGITHIMFSHDYKFFCISGRGDLIEVFKMSYYDVDGLLRKSDRQQGRSRSGTINSRTSGANAAEGPPRAQTQQQQNQYHNHHHHHNHNHFSFPPIIKCIEIVCRIKGHANIVNSVQFMKDNGDSQSTYKIVSCGGDGKIFVWEFDYKALPKVKKQQQQQQQQLQQQQRQQQQTSVHPTSHRARESRRSMCERKSSVQILLHSPSPASNIQGRTAQRRNKSEDPIHKNQSLATPSLVKKSANLASILSNDENSKQEDAIEVAASLYKKLQDIRNRKNVQKVFLQYGTIISPIVNDKLVPSIGIPLVTMDLSSIIPDGKINNVMIDNWSLWCFCKNGDLFKYKIV
ncbi:creC [Candida oxycetoniae]|uniref:CreC n=1 Tax=Candida oxycetoniae TaxID=497107 RepID=A0AAI9SXA0_9ASCO|nr:creC [Candida oxycetoniae]KAI3404432.2 creC [Candida oxycetoniae]